MFNRIIRIMATAAGCALILSGCSLRLDPVETKSTAPAGAIGFSAGSSALLLHDAIPTKGGIYLKEAFDKASDDPLVGAANADCFFVYGAKTISGTRYNVFDGPNVTLKNTGASAVDSSDDTWEYSPLRFWDDNASQYDFLAISGPASAAGITCNPAGSGHIRASLTYSPTVAQYDLLAAGAQRSDGTVTPVALSFQHVLSAVWVEIINESPSIEVVVNSYGFRNICTSATGTFEQSGNGLATMTTSDWSTPAYNGSVVLGQSGASDPLAKGGTYSLPADKWDLMIPQELTPYGDYIPQLMLDYEYDQENNLGILEHNNPVFPIRLDQIKVKNSDDLITSWEPGKKYNYEIHIRLGGGIVVTVAVTDWNEIPAETPGLTL